MREPCLLQSRRGLIELLCAVIENTTQRLVADSCCAAVSTCVKVLLLLHRLFVCVSEGELVFLSAVSLSAYQTCPLYLMLDQRT